MGTLYSKLKMYSESDIYPFHMPGHKRNREVDFMNPFQYDITEIDGFDNLHHSDGILLEAQKQAALLYKSSETYFLVNGSTCGILSAISACTIKGGKILIARNSHKAAYHGAFLNDLECIYTYPHKDEKYCVNGGLNIKNIKQLLITHQNIQAVFITSPTYDGVVSDVKTIAKEVHKYNIPLIVDEAHGAHFGFHSYFPESSIIQGADIVIHSLHKTLPSLTQTALLHVNGNIVNREKLKKYLSIYQTSSPSYVLMSSIDYCIKMLQKDANKYFDVYVKNLDELYERLSKLGKMKIMSEEIIGSNSIYHFDKSKIIISVKNTDMNGKILYQKLLSQYHLQLEMAAGSYALAMTSFMDQKEGYNRLCDALFEIDKQIDIKLNDQINFQDCQLKSKYKIAECDLLKKISVRIEDSEGLISAEYLYLYPPGIPLLVPGEVINRELILMIEQYKINGYSLEGLVDYEANQIQVVG